MRVARGPYLLARAAQSAAYTDQSDEAIVARLRREHPRADRELRDALSIVGPGRSYATIRARRLLAAAAGQVLQPPEPAELEHLDYARRVHDLDAPFILRAVSEYSPAIARMEREVSEAMHRGIPKEQRLLLQCDVVRVMDEEWTKLPLTLDSTLRSEPAKRKVSTYLLHLFDGP